MRAGKTEAFQKVLAIGFDCGRGLRKDKSEPSCSDHQAYADGRLRKPRPGRSHPGKTVALLIGYARVSKGDDQTTAPQRRALADAGVTKTYEEHASGGRWDRPRLHAMIEHLRDGDVVIVWKLDRLSRSLKDLLHILDRIETTGAGFRSLTEAIDTTTPAGRMMMQMVGAFAEFERAMIHERTSAGLDAARAEGRVGGRRPKLTPSQRADVVENVTSGRHTAAQMARLYRVSEPTVSRLLARARSIETPERALPDPSLP